MHLDQDGVPTLTGMVPVAKSARNRSPPNLDETGGRVSPYPGQLVEPLKK